MKMKMRKFKSLKLLGILFVCLVSVKESYAFFSPSTLQLIASSIGPWIQYILVIVVAAIISFLIKLKKILKKIIYSIIIIALILVTFLVLTNYNTLKGMNSQDSAAFMATQCCEGTNCDFERCGKLIADGELPYEDFLKSKYVDLNNISMEEYDTYQIVKIHPDSNIKLLGEKAIETDNHFLFSYLQMQEFLKNYDKKQKLLFYCYGGGYSQLLARVAHNLGYDAYHTRLSKVHNDKILNVTVVEKERAVNSIITVPYTRADKNKIYIKFSAEHLHILEVSEKDFGPIETYFYNIGMPKHPFLDREKLLTESNLEEVKEKLLDYDIICYGDLNCLLTQHFLFSINISQDIKEIYRIADYTI